MAGSVTAAVSMQHQHSADAFPAPVDTIARYQEARRQFYAGFPDFWADIAGKEYALLQVVRMDAAEQREIRQAAAAIWNLYRRVADLLRTLADENLLQLGLPASTLALVRLPPPDMPDTVIGRLDLVRTPDGYKMLEFNTDTPTFLYECYHVNGQVCAEYGMADVNAGERVFLAAALTEACRAALRSVGKAEGQPALIAFTSYPEHREDRGTTEFLRSLVELAAPAATRYVGIDALRIDATGLYTDTGDRIDVLYRLYPLEFFARDRAPLTGAPIGELLFDLVLRRQLALINPPSAFLLQSKAVQVVIWGLYEEGLFFDDAEREAIARHLLPTYLDPNFNTRYVVKPVYGREGDTVSIIDPQTGPQCENPVRSFTEQPMAYQQYVEMPEIDVMTEAGPQRLRALTSCFVVGGRAGSIGLRLGGQITNDACFFLPIAYKK